MLLLLHLPLLPLLLLLPRCSPEQVFPLRMPEARPTVSEVYLCTGAEVGSSASYWLTGFSPSSIPGTVHHMAVVGCGAGAAATPANLWNCGAGGAPRLQPGLPAAPPCPKDSYTTTLYLWSRGGVAYTLPPGTGFPVGGDSRVTHLVLQVGGDCQVYWDYSAPKRTFHSVPKRTVLYLKGLFLSYADCSCPKMTVPFVKLSKRTTLCIT